jgi:hypothetical protein
MAMPETQPSASPTPFCPFCRHPIEPSTDVLYDKVTAAGIYDIIYCGWCGAILGGGPTYGMHLGTKKSRG